ncbi:MAG: lamin tail domain-containing protein [Flavobacteriales bacterium]
MKRVITTFLVLLSIGATAQNMNLRINELMASNQGIILDDASGSDDWVEIYNPPGSPITNLAGYYLSDDLDSLDKWQIPATDVGVTTILPNNFLAIWVDDDANQGPDHVGGFTLSADGEMFILTAPDATTIIDSVTFGLQGPDVSYGRVCDGCEDWQFFNNVTFEDNNAEIQNTDLLFVNEVQASQTNYYDDLEGEFDAWFEIFNPNNHQVNLANYTITVSGNAAWTVPNNNPYRTVIPAGGFMLIWCDNDVVDDTNHAPITLNTTSGSITIAGPDESVVETYNYTSVPVNQSHGRQNDGSVSTITFPQPTPSVSNELVFVVPANLVINEVMMANQNDVTDNYGELEDWFEIYNPTNAAVNLAGYYFSDDPEVPMKWVVSSSFADSVTVEANGWLLFWADDDMNQGVQHTNFRLSNNGEYLGFYSPDGFTVVDELQWGYIAPDTSLGRITDGSETWVLFSGTTPDASNNDGEVNIINSEATTLVAFPNPATDVVYFKEKIDARVFSIDGALLGHYQNLQRLDVSTWSTGIYIVRADSGQVLRLVKK